MEIQSQSNDDTHPKKRPRIGDSPEALNPYEIREHLTKRGLAGVRQLVELLKTVGFPTRTRALSQRMQQMTFWEVSYQDN